MPIHTVSAFQVRYVRRIYPGLAAELVDIIRIMLKKVEQEKKMTRGKMSGLNDSGDDGRMLEDLENPVGDWKSYMFATLYVSPDSKGT